jgi:hypothetical protein
MSTPSGRLADACLQPFTASTANACPYWPCLNPGPVHRIGREEKYLSDTEFLRTFFVVRILIIVARNASLRLVRCGAACRIAACITA